MKVALTALATCCVIGFNSQSGLLLLVCTREADCLEVCVVITGQRHKFLVPVGITYVDNEALWKILAL